MNAQTLYVMEPDELGGEWVVFATATNMESAREHGDELPYANIFSAKRLEIYKVWVAEQKAKAPAEAAKYIARSRAEGYPVETHATPGLLDALADASTDSTTTNSLTNRLFVGGGWQVQVRAARLSR